MSVDNTPTGIVYTVTNGEVGQQYPLTFPYIKDDDVRAYYVHGDTQVTMSLGSGYSVSGQTFTASIALPVGAKLAIYRETDITQEILWVDGQAVYTPDIMQADDKLTFIVQEIAGDVKRAVKVSREEEAGGSTPESLLEGIYAARDGAQSASSAAQAAKTAAGQSAVEAAASAAGAAGDADLARHWASEAEDVPVQAGEFSARHYSEKAKEAVPENLVGRVETLEGRTAPATTTSRGIARVATLADMEPGAVVENGPAVIDATGGVITTTPTAHAVPQADGDGKLDAWVSLAGKANNDLSNLEPAAEDVIRSKMTLHNLGTRTTTGDWTLTNVEIGRLLLIVFVASSNSVDCTVSLAVKSGAVIGSSTFTGGAYGLGRAGSWISTNAFFIKPTATTVVVDIFNIIGTGTLYAEQI